MNIFMKQHLIEMVLQGKKTQTMRAWKRTPPKPGSICHLNFKIPVKITDRYQKKISELNKEELQRDGFNSMEEFKATWLMCYPVFDPEQTIWVIRFERGEDTV